MATQEFISEVPSKIFEPFIYFFFQQKISGSKLEHPLAYLQTTLPTGCTFIGFNFSADIEIKSCNHSSLIINYPIYFTGQHDSLYTMELPQNADLFGVVLRPTTASRLTKIPINELRNSVIEAEHHIDINLRDLHKKMVGANFNNRIQQFEQWISSKVVSTRQDSLFTDWAVQEIIKYKGIISTNLLAKTLKVSERHLQRSFKERIGLPPNKYATIIKVNNIVNDFRNSNVPLIDLLCHYRYHDKSHFRKQFRALTNTTLAAYMSFTNGTSQTFLSQKTFESVFYPLP